MEHSEGVESPQQEEPAANDASKARASMLREILKRGNDTSAAIPLEMLLTMYHNQFGINTQDTALPVLHAAIRNDKLRCAKVVLAHPEIDVAVRTNKKESVLLLALKYASDELCELLLAMPAAVPTSCTARWPARCGGIGDGVEAAACRWASSCSRFSGDSTPAARPME